MTHENLVHLWMNGDCTRDAGNMHCYTDRLVVNGKVMARKIVLHGEDGRPSRLLMLLSDTAPASAGLHSYSGYVRMIRQSVPGTYTHMQMGLDTGVQEYELPIMVLQFRSLNCDQLAPQTDEEYVGRLVYREVSSAGDGGTGPLDQALARMKARKHGSMTYWNGSLDDTQENLRTINEALIANNLFPQLAREIRCVWIPALIMARHTNEALAAAQLSSRKWQAVDKARVRRHGAFGHKPWEQRQKLNEAKWRLQEQRAKEREARIAPWLGDGGMDLFTAQVDKWRRTGDSRDMLEIPQEFYNKHKELRSFDYLHVVCDGTLVMTSRGVTVPFGPAVRMAMMVDLLWRSGRLDSLEGEGIQTAADLGLNQTNKHVGTFTLEYVSKDHAKVGCHRFKRAEVRLFLEMASQVKLTVTSAQTDLTKEEQS